jgi:hypothetical protein
MWLLFPAIKIKLVLNIAKVFQINWFHKSIQVESEIPREFKENNLNFFL